MYILKVYMHVSDSVVRGQKRVLDSLELVLQVVVSHLMWVLGIKLRSSARAALNY